MCRKSRKCAKCGKDFPSEAVYFEDREVFPDRQTICNECADGINLERAAKRQREFELDWARRWDRICPVRFRNTDPLKVPDPVSLAEVLSWEFGPDGILAYGPTSTGKTRSMYLLLHRLHFQERRLVVPMTAADFGNECGKLFWRDQGDADQFIRRLIRADVLYLDDLDKAKFTERTEAELFHVIDARTASGAPLLVTVNATRDELAAMLSDHRSQPLVRRLVEFCKSVPFAIRG